MSKNAKTKAPAKKNAKPAAKAAPKDTAADKAKAAKAAEIAKAQSEKAKHGEMIALASAQGHELSRTYEQSTVDVLGQMLGKKWEVSLGGAKLKDGAELSEAEAAKSVATLAEVSERNDTVRSTTMLALGGVILAIKDQFGDEAGDRLIQQTVSVTGKSKHTVQDAERVMRWASSVFKGDTDAVAGLTYTHLQELKNGSQDQKGNPTIQPADLRKIVKKVKEGKVVAAGKKANGEVIEQRKTLSCAETRELLVEAGGGKKKPKKDKAKAKTKEVDPDQHEFFYIDEDLHFFRSTGLDRSMLGKDGVVIIDATDKTMLNPKGAIHCSARDLPKTVEAQVTEAPAEEKKPEPPKADKPKKEAKDSKPKGKASIPD